MPIAHLLAPQILRRAQEIEDALYPRPAAAGYLQASAPVQRQYHPVEISAPALVRGEQPVRREKAPASEKAMTELRAEPAPRPDTVFKNAARRDVPRQVAKGKIKQIPNAPSPARGAVGTDEVVGMDESGRPIYASVPGASPVKKKKGRTTIALPAGPVGVNERGEAVAAGGKNLGYLRGTNPNVRTLERTTRDLPRTPHVAAPSVLNDRYGVQVLQQRFGPHLKAMQDNREIGPDGYAVPTGKFPEGYFDHMSTQAAEEIKLGVARLAEIERGTPI